MHLVQQCVDDALLKRMQDINQLKRLLNTPQRFVIVTHQKPDADALGSSLALKMFLEKMNQEAIVITPTDYPSFLNWMKGNDDVIIFDKKNENTIRELVQSATVICCLDFGCLSRIEALGEMVRQSDATKVLIDHHLEPESFADIVFWDTRAASTTELLYEVMCNLKKDHLIDKEIAECLYAGLMTDTGSFKHSNTTKNVHLVTADLIDKGADVTKVAQLIYDNSSIDRIRFIGHALSKCLFVLPEHHTAYFAISREDLSLFNSQTGDTEGLVNYALSVKGINFAAIIIDRNNVVKLSFRSTGDFSVNEFAKKYFEGGGHKNAAGGKSSLSFDDTIKKFTELVKQINAETII